MTDFTKAINRVLGAEGGYVNNPHDPGGETNWGIAKRSYPNVDIKKLTRDGAIAIYKRDFWDRVHGDELPIAIAFQVLDAAINHGVDRAVRFLQAAAGAAVDGQFGSKTLNAARSIPPAMLGLRFNAYRLTFYTSLETFVTFGRGWTNRVAKNLGYLTEDLL